MSKIKVELYEEFVETLMDDREVLEDIQLCDKDKVGILNDRFINQELPDYEYLSYVCSRVATMDRVFRLLDIIEERQIASKIRPVL